MENVALSAESSRDADSSTPKQSYHRWTTEQDQTVRDSWGKLSCSLIGQNLGFTKKSVRARARRLGLPILRTGAIARQLGIKPNWTEEQNQFLRNYWGKMSASLIAEKVGRTRSAVIGRANRLGLERLNKAAPGKIVRDRKVSQRTIRLKAASVIDLAPPIIDTEIPFEQRKTFMQLERGDCHWPVGDPGTPGFFFCGGKIFGDHSYCAAHYRRSRDVYRPKRSGFQFRKAA